jgi:hypothetical protein
MIRIPLHLRVPDPDFEKNALKLWAELLDELCDEKYIRRTHASRKTFEVGCRGPACVKCNRIYVYRRRGKIPPRLLYDLLTDFLFEQAKEEILKKRQQIPAELFDKLLLEQAS